MAVSGIANSDAAKNDALRSHASPERTPPPPPPPREDRERRPDERVQAMKETRAALPPGQGTRIDQLA